MRHAQEAIFILITAAVLSHAALAAAPLLGTYDEKVAYWQNGLDRIGEETDLSSEMTWAAIRNVTAWMYLGPCEGDATALRNPIRMFGQMASPDFGKVFDRAVLAMAGFLHAENLGRRPPEDMCRYAFSKADERR